jgi:hypothetical protein
MRAPQPQAATLCPDFLAVDEHVARNPVARAWARRQLKAAARDFATRIYMLADGEVVKADGLVAARVLAMAIRVCEQRAQQDSADCRVMRGGLEAVVQLSTRRWAWRRADATAVDTALRHAVRIYLGATALEQQAAHRFVTQLERQAGAAASQPPQPNT